MENKLDAATIRDLIHRIDEDDSFDPQKIACLGSYALELSRTVERLEDREQYARHTSNRWCSQTLKLSAENDELRAQLQSQAAELERLRAIRSAYDNIAEELLEEKS